MSNKSEFVQAMSARKLEMNTHKELNQGDSKDYDHSGKETGRSDNWSEHEYYKQDDGKLQHTKDVKEEQKNSDARRENLRHVLDDEKQQHDLEIKENQTSGISSDLKEQETTRRKLELEAELYGKWRYGADDHNSVFQSKTDNEVIAKLNWMDQQDEQHREKDEEHAKERDLRLPEKQYNKAEQLHKELQQIREQEIRQIRALQEMHMDQLNESQKEGSSLKEQDQKYREHLDELDKELELLEESYAALHQPSDFGGAFNLSKIMVYMRRRSQVYRNQIQHCLSILERCLKYAEKCDSLNTLKEKLNKQLDSEMYQLTQIDAMYESEAKYNLHKLEELWKLESSEHYKELKDLLGYENRSRKKLLDDVMQRQSDLNDMRSTHLNAIENTSKKLKQLIKEEEDSVTYQLYSSRNEQSMPGPLSLSNINTSPTPHNRGRGLYNHDYDVSTDVNHVTNTFSHLNMDVWENEYDGRDSDVVRKGGQGSLQVVTAANAVSPKFGHKRIDWN